MTIASWEWILHGGAKIWILFSSGKLNNIYERECSTDNWEKAENDVVNIFTSEDMKNTPLGSRM